MKARIFVNNIENRINLFQNADPGLKLAILSKSEAERFLSGDQKEYADKISSLISIGDPPMEDYRDGKFSIIKDLASNGFEQFTGHKARLEFDDVEHSYNGRYIPCTFEQIQQIIDFSELVHSLCLIHCSQGISRSSAAGLIVLAVQYGVGKEKMAVQKLQSFEKLGGCYFKPNRRMIVVADHLLERNGELYQAFQSIYGGAYRNILVLQPDGNINFKDI